MQTAQLVVEVATVRGWALLVALELRKARVQRRGCGSVDPLKLELRDTLIGAKIRSVVRGATLAPCTDTRWCVPPLVARVADLMIRGNEDVATCMNVSRQRRGTKAEGSHVSNKQDA